MKPLIITSHEAFIIILPFLLKALQWWCSSFIFSLTYFHCYWNKEDWSVYQWQMKCEKRNFLYPVIYFSTFFYLFSECMTLIQYYVSTIYINIEKATFIWCVFHIKCTGYNRAPASRLKPRWGLIRVISDYVPKIYVCLPYIVAQRYRRWRGSFRATYTIISHSWSYYAPWYHDHI